MNGHQKGNFTYKYRLNLPPESERVWSGISILAMDYEIEIDESMPEPLRIGLQGQVDSRLSNVTYFGLGPWENYSDRHAGVFLGTYRTTVEEMMTDYVYPQENGNRTGVRWFTVTDANGKGVQIIGKEPLSISAWNTTQESEELIPGVSRLALKCITDCLASHTDTHSLSVLSADSRMR